jgi:hypothetical protein
VTDVSGILVDGQALTDQAAPSVALAKTFSWVGLESGAEFKYNLIV